MTAGGPALSIKRIAVWAPKVLPDAHKKPACGGEHHGTGGDDRRASPVPRRPHAPAQRELRARAVASFGEGGYKVGYALVSLSGLVLIVWGFGHYRATGWIDVWDPPKVLKHITVALMLPAVILRGGGLSSAAASTPRSSTRCWPASSCGRRRI